MDKVGIVDLIKKKWYWLLGYIVLNVALVLGACYIAKDFSFSWLKTYELPIFLLVILLNSFFYEESGLYIKGNYCLYVFCLSILLPAMLLQKTITYSNVIVYCGFVPALFGFSTVFFCLLKKYLPGLRVLWGVGVALAIGIVVVQVALIWAYYFTFKTWLSTNALIAIMQTNASEAWEFCQQYGFAKSCFVLALVVMVCLAIMTIIYKLANKLNLAGTLHLPSFLIAAVLNLLLMLGTAHNMMTFVYLDAHTFMQVFNGYGKAKAERIAKSTPGMLIDNSKKGVYVLVIGESQHKKHLGLYGYNRPTTPWLCEQESQGNLLKFNNAFSCNSFTVATVPSMVTAMNIYNDMKLKEALSIVETAELGGYKTAWLSNQVKFGMWDTPITLLAEGAQQKVFINEKNYGRTVKTTYKDNKLVEEFQKLKLEDNMLIVFHLMGNHAAYKERYEDNFKKYTSGNNTDEYDNSVLYNDYVVKNIYEKASRIPNFMGLVYVSDHGEDVEAGGHNQDRFKPDMVEIPFYMLLSKRYKENNNETYKALEANKDKYFTNDLVFDCLLSVMGIRLPEIYIPENDIASKQYDGNPTRLKTLGGEENLSELYMPKERKEKAWYEIK